MRLPFLSAAIFVTAACGVAAMESAHHSSQSLDAQLLSVQEGIAPEVKTLTAGLLVQLEDHWKTYWRSPGEVGLPPEIDWSGSENIESVKLEYPAPSRFRAFGIENFGYEHEVLFPLQVTLINAGEPAVLRGDFSLLVCSDVCIPDDFSLALDFGNGTAIDVTSADLIAGAMATVPTDLPDGVTAMASMTPDALTVEISSDTPFSNPDIFPEYGWTAFGAPDIRLSESGQTLWAKFPVLGEDDEAQDLALTFVDGARAATTHTILGDETPTPPYESAAPENQHSRLWILFVALLGGLILNVMPCVLPVLSIKLSSAIKARDHSLARIRRGFLASAMGVLAFMWVLAFALIGLRAMGHTVGWGLQFQSPLFLTIMLAVILIFAANLIGLFEITLPQSWMTKMSATGNGRGYLADFSTGALAAVLATPCSAPFLGTAVAFALAGSVIDIIGVFTALGIGLATPYFLVALRPSLVNALPKPGRWMIWMKYVLGKLLLGTAIWLGWVLMKNSGVVVAGLVVLVLLGIVAVLAFGERLKSSAVLVICGCLFFVAAVVPSIVPTPIAAEVNVADTIWEPFNRAEIPSLVADGKTVFVDVTADWCLTCKANKRLVLSKGQVAEHLNSESVVPMIADWTKQDESIARFLQTNGRFGVPFNIVYGPNAPEGIALPEILTSDAVLRALKDAQG